MTPLTRAEITASRARLLAEGFTPGSKAIRVHDQCLSVMAELDALRVNNSTNIAGACQSMDDLKAECERRGELLEEAANRVQDHCGCRRCTALSARLRAAGVGKGAA